MANKKTDIDILGELSVMPSVSPRERTSTLKKTQIRTAEEKKKETVAKFKTDAEMNAYIEKAIQDAVKNKTEQSQTKPEKSSNTKLLDEYNNPRKVSSTGKHAGVNSFIRNLGTIGFGEERKDMVNHSAHANIKTLGKATNNKGDSKIADNILRKLNEREQKDKENKDKPKKPKFKSKKKVVDEEPEMLTEKKHYSFTKLGSINSPKSNLIRTPEVSNAGPQQNELQLRNLPSMNQYQGQNAINMLPMQQPMHQQMQQPGQNQRYPSNIVSSHKNMMLRNMYQSRNFSMPQVNSFNQMRGNIRQPNQHMQGNQHQQNTMQGNHMQGNHMQGNQMQGNHMQGNQFQQVPMPGNRMQGNQMQRNQFQQVPMPGNRMQGNQMQGNQFQQVPMPGNRMQGNQMQGSQFQQVPMPGNRMQGNQMQGNQMQGNQMQGNQMQQHQMQQNQMQQNQMQQNQMQQHPMQQNPMQQHPMQQNPMQQNQMQQHQMQQNQMQQHSYGEVNIPFVFIMPAYNGAKWIKKIFDSIKSQTYQNYRIIYVNDCSDDNTVRELEAYQKQNPSMNIQVIHNQKRQWPAYSRYIAARQTMDHEVIICLDGDDWLVDDNCLKTLNTVYQNPNIYATFGSMENAPWQFKKWKKYNRQNINDGEGAYFPHLRTTRANIVKAIPPYYMQTETSEWLHVCTDVALFMAVIEAVGSDGYVFLRNPFVHYNTSNHNKNSKEGYTNSKGSDMRIYYRSTIRDKIPMKKIVGNIDKMNQQYSYQ